MRSSSPPLRLEAAGEWPCESSTELLELIRILCPKRKTAMHQSHCILVTSLCCKHCQFIDYLPGSEDRQNSNKVLQLYHNARVGIVGKHFASSLIFPLCSDYLVAEDCFRIIFGKKTRPYGLVYGNIFVILHYKKQTRKT